MHSADCEIMVITVVSATELLLRGLLCYVWIILVSYYIPNKNDVLATVSFC